MSGIGYVPSFSSFPDLSKEKKRNEKKKRNKSREKDEQQERKSRRGEGDRKIGHKDYEYNARRRSRSPERRRQRSPSRDDKKDKKKSRYDIPSSSENALKTSSAALSSLWEPLHDERAKATEDRRRTAAEEKEGYSDIIGVGDAYSKPWFVDKKGDTLNVVYGGPHRGDVPKYHRAGRGKVLGMSSAWNIKRMTGTREVEIGPWDKKKVPRYTDSKSYRLLVEGPRQLLSVSSKTRPSYDDFIPVGKSNRLGPMDPRETNRSITEGDVSDHDDEDDGASGSRSESMETDGDEIARSTLPAEQETSRQLEEILRKSPSDEPSWLKLLSLSTSSITTRTKRAVRARAEIALSIIQRAWDASPENQHSVRLWLLYLAYGDEIWTKEDTEKQWQRMIQVLGHEQAAEWKRAAAWISWLDWKLATVMSVSGGLACSRRVLSILSGPQYETMRVRTCWRTAIFLREAGFLELAMAILQAQVEFSYFCPPDLSSRPFLTRLDQFELFWDAEVGRVGDDDATGWDKWEEHGRPEPQIHLERSSSNSGDHQDPYQLWFSQEKNIDAVSRDPTRFFDEDEQDPYSTIIFSDIRDFISDIQGVDSKEYLRLVLLSFLGLNIPGLSGFRTDNPGWDSEKLGPLEDAWTLSGGTSWIDRPDYLFPPIKEDRLVGWESQLGTIIALEKPKGSTFSPIKDWTLGRSYLEGVDASCNCRAWERAEIEGIDIQRIKNVFSQLRVDSREWDEMTSAFSAAVDVKSSIKASKQRLEGRSNASYLWKNHIRLERIRGDHARASKMYRMALGADGDMREMVSLYADAVEYFWFQDDETQVRSLISKFLGISESSSGSVYLLRGRKALDELLSAEQNKTHIEALFRLQFFFELGSSRIQDVVATFKRNLGQYTVAGRIHESLLLWLCITLHNLIQHRGVTVQPTLVAGNVGDAVKLYPDNTILLSLFLECERGQGIWGRVRNLLDDTTSPISPPKRLSRIAWEIWAEGQGYASWEPERVRNKLENALTTYRTRKSVVLWKVYIMLEMRTNMSKAKAVLIRAVDQCWWAKELYLMAFGPLRPVFSARELNTLFAMMIDRGIRTRRDIADLLMGWIDPSALEEDEEISGGDMEVEALVQSREQAKPF